MKIFREIRQNLLRQNKTTKYLTYALGEIVLVMIGILLALQVNTWNQNGENKLKVATILEQIERELLEDVQTANTLNLKWLKQDSLYCY